MREFEKSNYHIWHNAGLTGKGVKITILDDYTLADKDEALAHSLTTAAYINRVAPDAEIVDILPWGISSLKKLKDSPCQFICTPTGGLVNREIDGLIRDVKYGQMNRTFIVSSGNNTPDVKMNQLASNKRVITVGAIHDDKRAWYSQVGYNVFCMSFANVEIGGIKRQGTTYAAAFMTGGLALYAEYFERVLKRRPPEIHTRRLIRECALDLEMPDRDKNTGYGLFRLPNEIRIV